MLCTGEIMCLISHMSNMMKRSIPVWKVDIKGNGMNIRLYIIDIIHDDIGLKDSLYFATAPRQPRKIHDFYIVERHFGHEFVDHVHGWEC